MIKIIVKNCKCVKFVVREEPVLLPVEDEEKVTPLPIQTPDYSKPAPSRPAKTEPYYHPGELAPDTGKDEPEPIGAAANEDDGTVEVIDEVVEVTNQGDGEGTELAEQPPAPEPVKEPGPPTDTPINPDGTPSGEAGLQPLVIMVELRKGLYSRYLPKSNVLMVFAPFVFERFFLAVPRVF